MVQNRSRAIAVLVTIAAAACGQGKGTSSGTDHPPGVTVLVSPERAPLAPLKTLAFVAAVYGTADTRVTWSASGGTIDGTGAYTAPSAEGTFTVVATSVADPGRSGSALVVVSAPSSIDPNGIVPDDRVTKWNPGIPGGVPRWTNIHSTIRAATYSVAGTDPRGAAQAINGALAAAAAVATPTSPQVVYVEPGTYQLTGTIVFSHYRYVVLRGAGANQTRLRGDQASGPVIWFNSWPSTNWGATAVADVIGDVPKGATQVTVSDASQFQAGDIIQIDQLDDPSYVYFYDSIYFKRGLRTDWVVAGPLSPDGYRSVNEMLEITGKSGNVLAVSAGRRSDGTPVPWGTHIKFSSALHPQVFVKNTTRGGDSRASTWCGVEDLYLTGGTSNAIRLWNTSYSWVKGVEIDGDPSTAGIPAPPGGYITTYLGNPNIGGTEPQLVLDHCFRCEVRDSYIHHTQRIAQGGSSYGVVLRYGSSNCLVENNIVVYFDKLITSAVDGGGNVFGYNYADNAYTTQRGWQEGALDLCHEAFCHGDLAEGNWAAEMGAESTHGNTGWHTFFRNYARGGNTGPDPEGNPVNMTGNTHAVQSTAWLREMSFVGNVLDQSISLSGNAPVYQYDRSPTPAAPVWRIGDNLWYGNSWDATDGTSPPSNVTSTGASSVPAGDIPYVAVPTFTTRALDMLYRHGNWDSVTNGVVWDPGNPIRAIPNSLYLTLKPAFFGTSAWPWIDPLGATAADRVKELPAKARYDSGRPNG